LVTLLPPSAAPPHSDQEDHLKHVEEILRILEKNELHISGPKSFAGYPEIHFLGQIVDGQGTRKTNDRIIGFKRITKCLDDMADLERYIGMATWLRKGVPWFDIRIIPLQSRKTKELAIARKNNTLPTGTLSAPVRKTRASKIQYTPIAEEIHAFDDMQTFLCEQLQLYNHKPSQYLFIKVDTFRFQSLVTGYWPDRRFRRVNGSALEQHLGPLHRATEIDFDGEAQLWTPSQPRAQEEPPLPLGVIKTLTGSSAETIATSRLFAAETLREATI
jgi:hypothetical protein